MSERNGTSSSPEILQRAPGSPLPAEAVTVVCRGSRGTPSRPNVGVALCSGGHASSRRRPCHVIPCHAMPRTQSTFVVCVLPERQYRTIMPLRRPRRSLSSVIGGWAKLLAVLHHMVTTHVVVSRWLIIALPGTETTTARHVYAVSRFINRVAQLAQTAGTAVTALAALGPIGGEPRPRCEWDGVDAGDGQRGTGRRV
ncbi:hypothetical protein IQ07DRAFT_185646 [Pyrenochaeta sp. DS3sAY3a]|nr:hypothetical protein IQ07DRAFT_185646 [Pyrenochaeta sp. DS3sAY3a]